MTETQCKCGEVFTPRPSDEKYNEKRCPKCKREGRQRCAAKAQASPQWTAKDEDRFWSKVDKTSHPDGCWIWTACQRQFGYGEFWWAGKLWLAYRLSWERLRGPIPDGLHIDHLCRNPSCVNPDHLEPVTPLVNTRRGLGNRQSEKTHCIHGHPFSPENTAITTHKGIQRRVCITCRRERDLKKWHEKRKMERRR